MNSDVYVNGHHVGNWPYGYTTFEYDITPYTNSDGKTPNVVAVRVANLGVNSRWYSGSGIFRHVWLSVRGPVYIPTHGLQLSTPHIVLATPGKASSADVFVNVTINNTGVTAISANVLVALHMVGGDLTPVGVIEGTLAVGARTNATITLSATLTGSALRLWSTASPNLYVANASIIAVPAVSSAAAAASTDTSTTTFGVRHISFDSSNGFLLNGVPVNMWGGCVHHDNGPLGSMAIDRADERRVENLKKLGYNAIRTSHNPASPAFLAACDRLGVLVMAEAFDCWAQGLHCFCFVCLISSAVVLVSVCVLIGLLFC
jgi:beta-galactosidase